MPKVCLQPGHVNKGGGAPNELATNKRITDRLSAVLRERGIEVYQTDANGYNDPKVTKQDYDLFLAIHCDMDYPNDNGSGFSDYSDPDLSGVAFEEGRRISTIINNIFFPETGINYKSRSNLNTKRYYMWKYLTSKTPCVLIEMGQSIDPHDSVLLGNTDLIANALGMSICKALGVTWELAQPPIVNPEIQVLKDEIDRLNRVIGQGKVELEGKLATKDRDCQSKFDTFKNYLIKTIEEYK